MFMTLCIASVVPVQGRLGETKDTIDSRLRNSNSGDSYRREVQETKARQGPYARMLPMLEAAGIEFEVHVWWNADGDSRLRDVDLSRPRTNSGWDYFVVFFDGRSVLEGYRRNSGNISVYERDELLRRNFGTDDVIEHSEPLRDGSYFTWQYESDDGTMRGVMSGRNQLMVFKSEFDRHLAEMNRQWRELMDQEAQQTYRENIVGF